MVTLPQTKEEYSDFVVRATLQVTRSYETTVRDREKLPSDYSGGAFSTVQVEKMLHIASPTLFSFR
jgi:hypothetical protein